MQRVSECKLVVFYGAAARRRRAAARAEAAASPQGWPPLKKKVYNGKWYYTSAGTYTGSLEVVKPAGCRRTTTASVTVSPLPTANFSAPASACARAPVTFTNASTGATQLPVGLRRWGGHQHRHQSHLCLHHRRHLHCNAHCYQRRRMPRYLHAPYYDLSQANS
jgi:hypothetical protein